MKLLKKKGGRTRRKGGQRHNTNGQKHGFYSTVIESLFDQRTKFAIALSEMRTDLMASLGGAENLSPQETILLDRVIAKTARCVMAEAAMLAGEDKPAEEHYLV